MSMFRKLLCTTLGVLALTGAAQAVSDVVISQVYGGGGNTNAQYQRDFVELFNRSPVAQPIGGWSIQYSSATGTSWASNKVNIPAGATIAAGGYYLIQLSGN